MIEVNHPAFLAVESDEDVALVVDAEAEFAAEPIGSALRLATDILVKRNAIDRVLPVENEVGVAKQEIIVGKVDLVVAGGAYRPGIRLVLGVPWAAAVESFSIVNHATAIGVNEGAVDSLVAVALAGRPIIHVAGRDPNAISGNGAWTVGFTEDHKAFARGRIGREKGTGRCWVRIGSGDVERNHGVQGLAGNRSRIESVPGDRVTAGAVILHRDINERGAWIDPVTESGASQAVRIVHARGDHDGFIGGGQSGMMRDVVNDGAGV